jgi:hypothetical protein
MRRLHKKVPPSPPRSSSHSQETSLKWRIRPPLPEPEEENLATIRFKEDDNEREKNESITPNEEVEEVDESSGQYEGSHSKENSAKGTYVSLNSQAPQPATLQTAKIFCNTPNSKNIFPTGWI